MLCGLVLMMRAAVQISQNPKLTKLNLPMLEAIGGPLIIQNNTALASLESLEHLTVVNATGRVPSIKMPGLLVSASILPRKASSPGAWTSAESRRVHIYSLRCPSVVGSLSPVLQSCRCCRHLGLPQ